MTNEAADIVTFNELARRWNADRAEIARLVTRGLPVRGDGRFDWKAANTWIGATFSRPVQGLGSFGTTQKGEDKGNEKHTNG